MLVKSTFVYSLLVSLFLHFCAIFKCCSLVWYLIGCLVGCDCGLWAGGSNWVSFTGWPILVTVTDVAPCHS